MNLNKVFDRTFLLSYVFLLVRLFIGVLFIIAGLAKLDQPAFFAHSIEQFDIVSRPVLIVMTYTLPWLELICGVLLILGLFLRASAMLIGLMLLTFIIALLSAMARGIAGECGCLGFFGSGRIGWPLTLQDTALLITCAVIYIFGDRHKLISIDSLIAAIKGKIQSHR